MGSVPVWFSAAFSLRRTSGLIIIDGDLVTPAAVAVKGQLSRADWASKRRSPPESKNLFI